MEETLEKLVADTILQRADDTITIDGHEFEITPPTPATLIMVSELVSQLPIVNKNTTNAMLEVLSSAKDLAVIGKIVAVLILGGKRIKEKRKICKTEVEYYTRWSWRKLRKVVESRTRLVETLEIDWLSEKLLNEVTNETLTKIVANRLGKMQLGHFFDLTASLSEANLIRRTREAVETAFGEKSSDGRTT